jgi:hypothetical protein
MSVEENKKNGRPVVLADVIKKTSLNPDLIFDILINSTKFNQEGKEWVLNE